MTVSSDGLAAAVAAHSQPVFVIGSPRSGTSALAWALAAHPDLWLSAESDHLWFLLGDRHVERAFEEGCRRGRRHWLVKQEVSLEEYAAWVGLGIDRLYLSRSGGRRWIEQTPLYTMMARELALLFPRSRFVHIVRNGAEVVDSLIHSGFGTPMARSFSDACRGWVRYVRAGEELAQAYPERVYTVRHEELVARPDSPCQGLLEFLGLTPTEAPAKFLRERTLNSSFPQDVGDGASAWPQKNGRNWGLLRRQRFRRIAGALMKELGHPLPSLGPFRRARSDR